MHRRGTAVAALVAGLLAAPAASSAAEPLRFKTGGSPSALEVQRTASGTYVASIARRPKDKFATRVTRIESAAAIAAPALPVTFDEGDMVLIPREDGAEPCVAGMAKSSPYVGCLENGAWRERRFTGPQRSRELFAVLSRGGTMFAFSDATDPGAFERAADDPKKLARLKLTMVIERWDGTRWVSAAPAVPGYTYSLLAIRGPSDCLAVLVPGACGAPELLSIKSAKEKVTVGVQSVSSGRWTADASRRVAGIAANFFDAPVLVDGRLVLPFQKGRNLTLRAAGGAGPASIQVATLAGRDYTAQLGVVAGRLWVAWADIAVPNVRKGQKGDPQSTARAYAAPVDLAAGTVGAAQAFGSTRFGQTDSSRVTRPLPVDIAGAPHVAYVEQDKRGDSAVVYAATP